MHDDMRSLQRSERDVRCMTRSLAAEEWAPKTALLFLISKEVDIVIKLRPGTAFSMRLDLQPWSIQHSSTYVVCPVHSVLSHKR